MANRAPQQDRSRFLMTMLIVWALSFFAMQYLLPRPQAPGQAQSALEAARQLEAEGRASDNRVSLAERIKKLEQAIGKYEEYYNANKQAPDAPQARFNQINIYDFLARLEGERAGTKWYDAAEHRLKDMENAFHGKTGTVKVEENGEVFERTGNLGEIASARLNSIRAARDVVNRNKITYKLLDGLVAVTGRNPSYSYFLALLFVVVVVKTLAFPFQKKQYRYMQDMMRIAPLLKEVQEKYKDRPAQEIQQRQMQLYREHNVNLAAGCVPMLVMMFTLIPVFWMVRDYEYQFTYAQFLWIGSEFSRRAWWLADNLAQFDVPMFVVYTISTVLYSLLQPKPVDPQQAQQQRLMMFTMPVVFGIFMWMGKWSSAFLLYWLLLNLVSMYQSWILNKQFGMYNRTPATAAAGAATTAPAVPEPLPPLEPMKGVGRARGNGKREMRQVRARVRPKNSGS